MATLSGFYGALAAALAIVGLYGIVSYMVARRRHELGIRMAVGADKRSILQMILREAIRSEEHTSELQSLAYLVCRLLLEKKNVIFITQPLFDLCRHYHPGVDGWSGQKLGYGASRQREHLQNLETLPRRHPDLDGL